LLRGTRNYRVVIKKAGRKRPVAGFIVRIPKRFKEGRNVGLDDTVSLRCLG
jgi:hypothetical protein